MSFHRENVRARGSVTLLVVLTTILTLLLASCGTMPRRDGLSLRASAGAGVAHVRGKTVIPATGEEQRESAVGSIRGVRVELTEQPTYLRNVTAGLRLQGNLRDVSEDGLGQSGDGRLRLETVGGELQGVLRRYFPVTDSFRPYGEVFAGVSYDRGDLAASGGGLPGAVADRGSDWSGMGGAGLGLELDLSRKVSLFVQGDYSIRLSEVDPFDFRLEDVTFWVGGEVRF